MNAFTFGKALGTLAAKSLSTARVVATSTVANGSQIIDGLVAGYQAVNAPVVAKPVVTKKPSTKRKATKKAAK